MNMSTLLVVALTASTAVAPETPVVISDLVTGSASHVRITNTSRQPVTAWSLAAITEPSAGRTHREVYTTDGYLSEVTHGLPRASEQLERLLPGDSRDLPLDPLPDGAKVQVIAVVLDDGTAMGDEAVLASIFARRVKERDALKAVADTFNVVLPVTHGGDALAALKERFAVLVERDNSVPCRVALEAVQAYPPSADADRIDASLHSYAAFVMKEYEVAARHAERKEPPKAAPR
jgi:hypothetical protein